MKRFILMFLIFISSYLSAEDLNKVEFISAEYEPVTVRTGDSVFCRIKFSKENLSFENAGNIKTEKNVSFEVTDIKLNISSNEILLWFIPFNPSEKYLPVIKGRDFILEKVPVKIIGYAESGDSPPEPPGAVLLPGTRLFLGFVFFLLCLFFFLAYFFVKYFYKPLKGGISGILREFEIKKILSQIRSLDYAREKTDPDVFCCMLSRLFRKYLEMRLMSRFMSLTSSEITDKLLLSGILSPANAESLGNALFCSDRIRFGRRGDSEEKCLSAVVKAVNSAVDFVESDRLEGRHEKNDA